MTTIFISKMEGLPPTSSTKMIDCWLILCQLVPFVEVVLLTIMEYYREDEKKDIDGDVVWGKAGTKKKSSLEKKKSLFFWMK